MFCLTIFRIGLSGGPERREVSPTGQTSPQHVSHHPGNDNNSGRNYQGMKERPTAMDAEDATEK